MTPLLHSQWTHLKQVAFCYQHFLTFLMDFLSIIMDLEYIIGQGNYLLDTNIQRLTFLYCFNLQHSTLI